ncbi:hypothetical protein C8R46DRAFT_1039063 [Mycena filopes]|nr:hypothetical protein C8R46DRAFT_1039063 [Mycena filopes]
MCWTNLGNYKEVLSACVRARELLALCGLAEGEMDSAVLNTLGEVHRFKTEYVEAHNIHDQILHKVSVEQDPFDHACAVFNRAEVDLRLGAPREHVEAALATVRSIFTNMGYSRGATLCALVSGDLELREGNAPAASQLLQNCVHASQGKDGEIMTIALGLLANAKRWSFSPSSENWSVVFLVHALKSEEQLEIHRALQFLAEIFLQQGEAETAATLFAVALERFTQMDIHQNRAECMFGLGDILQEGGDSAQAVEMWTTARPLFERSLQLQEVGKIDESLAAVEEKHRRALAELSTISAPSDEVVARDPEQDNHRDGKEEPDAPMHTTVSVALL